LVKSKLFDYLSSQLQEEESKNPVRIVVSRGATKTRKWLNELECMKELEPLGFKSVDPSQMSLKDQVSLFSRAEIILGPHGAGLTNIMFANSDAKVLEFRSSEQQGNYSSGNCYEQLSNILGIEHHVLKCKSIKREELKGRSIEDADLVPNPFLLKDYLCQHLL